jgi:hypothetical protein
MAAAESAPSIADLPAPRRVAIATLFRQAWHIERELAALYAAFARHAPVARLRAALDELATLKGAHAAAIAALAPVLDPEGGESRVALEVTASAEPAPESRSDLFGRAFAAERSLDAALREIGALLGDPARCPGLWPVAVEAARHRSLLRDLYLWYS